MDTQRSKTTWIGWILSALAIAFLTFDSVIKVMSAPPAVQGTTQLGFPASAVVPIGILELFCLAMYVSPRTAVLGAVLLTGYLGGAIATHVRLENPLFTHILFPVYVAALIWAGVWLRDRRILKLMVNRS